MGATVKGCLADKKTMASQKPRHACMTQKASTGKSMEQEPNERYTDRNVGSSDRKNGSSDRKYGSTERGNGLAGYIVRTTAMYERQTGEQAYCTFYKANPPPFLPRCNDQKRLTPEKGTKFRPQQTREYRSASIKNKRAPTSVVTRLFISLSQKIRDSASTSCSDC